MNKLINVIENNLQKLSLSNGQTNKIIIGGVELQNVYIKDNEAYYVLNIKLSIQFNESYHQPDKNIIISTIFSELGYVPGKNIHLDIKLKRTTKDVENYTLSLTFPLDKLLSGLKII